MKSAVLNDMFLRSTRRQRGSLLISLIMLIVVLMLGISAAQIALQGEKGARSDRDRQIALHAAEAALLDAEMDIEGSPDASKSRSHIFSGESALGFPADGEAVCQSGDAGIYLGLCRTASGGTPAWRLVDFAEEHAGSMTAVPYGRFTGQLFQVGSGTLPAKTPRYIIELIPFRRAGLTTDKPSYVYRITAVGFGANERTQVALQSIYRKEGT